MGKAKEPEKPSSAWQGTYGDMITLMLCFFVMMYDPSEVDVTQLATITQSLQMQETETVSGGLSLSAGRLSDLGNNINSLPSLEKGKSLGLAKKKAVSLFAPDKKTNKITWTSDERGLIITLLSDNFFEEGSAELNINETRESLPRLAEFFTSPEVKDFNYRIEGHTDSTPVPASSIYPSNWELSTARAANVLHFLADYGVNENKFSLAGYADTKPKFKDSDLPEAKAYDRRVDIIILDEGHF